MTADEGNKKRAAEHPSGQGAKRMKFQANDDKDEVVALNKWTEEEDKLIVELFKKSGGTDWAKVASRLPGRTEEQCQERYTGLLNPQEVVKDDWDEDEDRIILMYQMRGVNRWTEIAKVLPKRTESIIKQHWETAIKPKVEEFLAGQRNLPVDQVTFQDTIEGQQEIRDNFGHIIDRIRNREGKRIFEPASQALPPKRKLRKKRVTSKSPSNKEAPPEKGPPSSKVAPPPCIRPAPVLVPPAGPPPQPYYATFPPPVPMLSVYGQTPYQHYGQPLRQPMPQKNALPQAPHLPSASHSARTQQHMAPPILTQQHRPPRPSMQQSPPLAPTKVEPANTHSSSSSPVQPTTVLLQPSPAIGSSSTNAPKSNRTATSPQQPTTLIVQTGPATAGISQPPHAAPAALVHQPPPAPVPQQTMAPAPYMAPYPPYYPPPQYMVPPAAAPPAPSMVAAANHSAVYPAPMAVAHPPHGVAPSAAQPQPSRPDKRVPEAAGRGRGMSVLVEASATMDQEEQGTPQHSRVMTAAAALATMFQVPPAVAPNPPPPRHEQPPQQAQPGPNGSSLVSQAPKKNGSRVRGRKKHGDAVGSEAMQQLQLALDSTREVLTRLERKHVMAVEENSRLRKRLQELEEEIQAKDDAEDDLQHTIREQERELEKLRNGRKNEKPRVAGKKKKGK